jgi:hypothetical protein
MLEANAVNGVNRQVANRKINTAAVVNEAITRANGQALDLDGARAALQRLGHSDPASEMVESYAYQVAVLAALQSLTGASTGGQIGKWNFTSAQSVHDAFNSYLNRRVQGQRSRWNRR